MEKMNKKYDKINLDKNYISKKMKKMDKEYSILAEKCFN